MKKCSCKWIVILCTLGILHLIRPPVQMADVQTAETGGTSRAVDIVLVLDNSGSMKINDPEFLMRDAVAQTMERFDENARIGMVVFDQSVRLAEHPRDLTDLQNRAKFLQSLEAIDYTGDYSDSPAAIERAIYELKAGGREDAGKIIILMTDGIVDTGDRARDIEKGQWLKDELALEAEAAGIKIFGIAFTDKADFRLIQSIAIKTGGDYFRAYKAEDILAIFNKIFEKIVAEKAESGAEKVAVDLPGKEVGSRNDSETAQKGDTAGAAKTAEGQVVAQAAPVRKPEQSQSPNLIITLAGVAVLTGIIVVALLLRRKKPGDSVSDTGASPIPGASLVDLDGISGLEAISLTRTTTNIGRDKSNDIVIPDDTVSSQHAVIEYKEGFFYLEDYGSKNKTRLNGAEIPSYSHMKLKSGDKISFNKFNFEFTLPSVTPAGETVMDFHGDDYTAVSKHATNGPHLQPETELEEMPHAMLVDVKNITGRKTIRLNRRIMKIGRGVHNDIVIKEKSISGSHATIEFRDGEFFLEDYRSRNQTWLNGEGIKPHDPEKLKSGDEIVFDAFPFIFMLERQMPAGETGNRW